MAQPLKTVTDDTQRAAEPAPNNSSGLALLRAPFPENQVSKLPKGTRAQNDCPPSEKRNCAVCGGWHHPKVVHLDYVGHAALTDRLLEADPMWSWQPMALTLEGLPLFDGSGGLWIRLTVCGVTRLGYGHAAGKAHMDMGAREKEVIGDALRNAAMRFGAALDLWHKGDLHGDDGKGGSGESDPSGPPGESGGSYGGPSNDAGGPSDAQAAQGLALEYLARFAGCKTPADVKRLSDLVKANWDAVRGVQDFTAQLVKARDKAIARVNPQRQAGED